MGYTILNDSENILIFKGAVSGRYYFWLLLIINVWADWFYLLRLHQKTYLLWILKNT